jgi:hypothetical protein
MSSTRSHSLLHADDDQQYVREKSNISRPAVANMSWRSSISRAVLWEWPSNTAESGQVGRTSMRCHRPESGLSTRSCSKRKLWQLVDGRLETCRTNGVYSGTWIIYSSDLQSAHLRWRGQIHSLVSDDRKSRGITHSHSWETTSWKRRSSGELPYDWQNKKRIESTCSGKWRFVALWRCDDMYEGKPGGWVHVSSRFAS